MSTLSSLEELAIWLLIGGMLYFGYVVYWKPKGFVANGFPYLLLIVVSLLLYIEDGFTHFVVVLFGLIVFVLLHLYSLFEK